MKDDTKTPPPPIPQPPPPVLAPRPTPAPQQLAGGSNNFGSSSALLAQATELLG
jgi:hypothetical protein